MLTTFPICILLRLSLLIISFSYAVAGTHQTDGIIERRQMTRQSSLSVITRTVTDIHDTVRLSIPSPPLVDGDDIPAETSSMNLVPLDDTVVTMNTPLPMSPTRRRQSFGANASLLSATQILGQFIPEHIARPKNGETIWILSVDGGGQRGVIPATILAEIEKKVKKPIYKIFDVMVGTSTGGIILQALNVPTVNERGETSAKYSAQDLMDLYVNHGDKIFGRKFLNILSCCGMLRPKYSSKGLTRMTSELFGDTKLSDALGNVIVTGFEIG